MITERDFYDWLVLSEAERAHVCCLFHNYNLKRLNQTGCFTAYLVTPVIKKRYCTRSLNPKHTNLPLIFFIMVLILMDKRRTRRLIGLIVFGRAHSASTSLTNLLQFIRIEMNRFAGRSFKTSREYGPLIKHNGYERKCCFLSHCIYIVIAHFPLFISYS